MVVRKFHAATTREALRMVREALGEDALILSNRSTAGGVEIRAAAESDFATVLHSAATPASAPAAAAPATGFDALMRRAGAGEGFERAAHVALADEVRELRGMVEGQLAALTWSQAGRRDPRRAEIARRLLRAGFGASLSRKLAAALPAGLDTAASVRWVKAILRGALSIVAERDSIVQHGGVFALVGPTGVGKTTTVAKLAAACVLRAGAGRVALVTTDSYRIGAVDQLRVYGKILGVPVHAIRDEDDLRLTLSELSRRHLVLIDTVGMSQRDRRLAEQISLLCGNGKRVRRLLLLAAVSQGRALEDVVQAYRGAGLEGAILTKVDESPALGGALDVLIRSRLPLHYLTNGQRVPEDLHQPSALYLVERAFREVSAPSGFALEEPDFPLAMALAPGFKPQEAAHDATIATGQPA